MGAFLDDIATYLDAQTSLAWSTDLFVGDMPDAPDGVTVLHEPGGSAPIEMMGADSKPAVIQPRVQVLGRSTSYSLARARVRLVYDTLVLVTNEDLNSTYHLRCAPVQEPFLLHRDERERPVFAVNLDVWRVAE